MKTFIYVVFILFFISSCVSQSPSHNERYELQLQKTTAIPFDAQETVLFVDLIASDSLVIGYKLVKREIVVKSLKNGEVKSTLPFTKLESKYHDKFLMSMKYISQDSIFLLFNPGENKNYSHDSSLVLVNMNGKILHAYSWKEAEVPSNQYRYPYRSDTISYCLYIGKMMYNNNRIYLPLQNLASSTGDSTFIQYPSQLGGHFDLKADQFVPHNLIYPSRYKEHFSRNTKNSNLLPISEDKVMYYFGNKGNLYEYDLRTQKYKTHIIKSQLIDSIPPYKFQNKINYRSDVPSEDPKNSEYGLLSYNPYENIYIRLYCIRNNKENTLYGKLNPQNGFMVIDSNFQCIGEGVVDGIYEPFYRITPKGEYITWGVDRDAPNSPYILKYYKLVKTNTVLDDNNIQQTSFPAKKGLDNYLKNVHGIRKKDALVILIPIDVCCVGCRDFTINHYLNNILPSKQENIYVVLASQAMAVNAITETHQKFNMSGKEYNILYDKTGEYAKYVPADFESIHALTLKNGKIVKDQELPGQMTDLIPEIFEKFMKQK